MASDADLAKAIAVTAELTGTELSKDAAKIMVSQLSSYEPDAVLKALARCQRELKGRLTLAAIIERIDDGWPAPETALGLAFQCAETEDCVICPQEVLTAWGEAQPALDAGDRYGFRQTFLAAYTRLRDGKRAGGNKPAFVVSGGTQEERDQAIVRAVEEGRLGIPYLRQVVELPATLEAKLLGYDEEETKLLGLADTEEAREGLAALKAFRLKTW